MAHTQSLVYVSIVAKHNLRHNRTLEAADIFYKNVLRKFGTRNSQLCSSSDRVRYHVLRTAQRLMQQIRYLPCTTHNFLRQQAQELGIHAGDCQADTLLYFCDN